MPVRVKKNAKHNNSLKLQSESYIGSQASSESEYLSVDQFQSRFILLSVAEFWCHAVCLGSS